LLVLEWHEFKDFEITEQKIVSHSDAMTNSVKLMLTLLMWPTLLPLRQTSHSLIWIVLSWVDFDRWRRHGGRLPRRG